MPISVCGRVKPKVKPVLLVQPPFVSVKSFPTRRQNVKSYFCRLLSVSDSRLADVPGAWFYKQRLHRIAIWLRRSFSVGSSFLKQGWFFYLEANILHWYCSRKMTGGPICSPVWLLLNLTCVRSWGGGLRNRMFAYMRYSVSWRFSTSSAMQYPFAWFKYLLNIFLAAVERY